MIFYFILIIAVIMFILTEIFSFRITRILIQNKSKRIVLYNLIFFVLCLIIFIISLYLATSRYNKENAIVSFTWIKISSIYLISLLFNFFLTYFVATNNIRQKNKKNFIIKSILTVLVIISVFFLIASEYLFN